MDIMDISIVIPALNESTKIRFDAEAAASFIKDTGLSGEVIIVDDGSTDGTAETARKADIPASVKLSVIRLEKNSGKGYAVKTGIEKTGGNVVLFADSGTCIPYANALEQIERIRAGELDIAIASRRLKDTRIIRDRRWKRRMLSWLFRQAAIAITGLPRRITDSQCGFKLYTGKIARELFSQCQTRDFLFEIEILLRALQKDYRVEEFPVEWTCDLDTRLRPGRIAFRVLKELFRVRSIVKK
ncbi:MAG: glycosyltransferase [Candidatus Aminicenantes bacterium]|nr:MAG: glycosyltransferase [Candidatus Aminicenantes bacterium]